MVISIITFFALYLACFFVFIGKAIADITADETAWNKSVFSKHFSIDSFFGSKDRTWTRKYRKNKFWNFMFNNILVFTTDIWHLANFFSRIGLYLSIFFAMLIGGWFALTILDICLLISAYVLLNVCGFHLFYHYILRK
jgi:hypothetical protein